MQFERLFKNDAEHGVGVSAKVTPTLGKGQMPHSTSEFQMWRAARKNEKADRSGILLWRQPWRTLRFSLMETILVVGEQLKRFWKMKRLVIALALFVSVILIAHGFKGPHSATLTAIVHKLFFCLYWISLGVLSSVGLGTGLHTFLLYLGPHIAAVTLAAHECRSLNFPQPPYPDSILCPEGFALAEQIEPSLLDIMSKVRLESFMWGVGTAIGELPPYFMARAARLTGRDPDDEEMDDFEELLHSNDGGAFPSVANANMSAFERTKLMVHNLVQRVGFPGILLCASIPNPLFDLAGITCGHFLVPFWTFFGATFLGKAIVKMHIQKMFVIFAFSQSHVDWIVSLLGDLPRVGPFLRALFTEYLSQQRAQLHKENATLFAGSTDSWLKWCFEKLVIFMVVYFVVSIINSLAQDYHKRLYRHKQTEVAPEYQSSHMTLRKVK